MKTIKPNTLYVLLFCAFSQAAFAASGYYSPRNLQSFAFKNVQDNTVFNNQTMSLGLDSSKNPSQGLQYGVGHTANTQFANTGYAGCGVSFPMMQEIYKVAGQNNYSNNYLALNVYSHLMGYDANAPVWSSTSGEGSVKGYLNFATGKVGYPYRQYLRSMPALYPSYLGLYDNGLSCGRWAQVNVAQQTCTDSSGISVGYASKVCTSQPATSYASKTFYGYVFDSCEDNNGWCRDDDAHLDMNSAITQNNSYISWKFTTNPYYTDPNAPSQLKDVWLAWYNNPNNAWWTYIEVANLPDGLGMLQFNIGSSSNPIWVNSHYQAGGSNNMTWSEGTSNGQTWQLQPLGSLIDNAPPTNPSYQIRLFDINGYPIRNGQIYQFDLATTKKSGTQPINGEILFYKGQPGQGSSIITAPIGSNSMTINVKNLPSAVTLSTINPVLIDDQGFSYNPTNCTQNSCTYQKLPTATKFRLYGVYTNETSNDLVVRKQQRLAINQTGISLSGTSGTISIDASSWDFTTMYTAAVTVPIKFNVTQPPTQSANANLQALFVPSNTSSVTANTQGCFLNNYYSSGSTQTTCFIYYTAHQKGSFNSSIPSMTYSMLLPKDIGVSTTDHLQLQGSNTTSVTVTGYNPGNVLVIPKTVATATYQPATGSQRSLYVLIDPNSDQECLSGFNSVNINLGSNPQLSLSASNIDNPVVTSVTSASNISGAVSMNQGSATCQANMSQSSITPGLDLVTVVKLSSVPTIGSIPTPTPSPTSTPVPSPSPAPIGNKTCTAVANVGTSPGWNGCNVTFDVTNTSSSSISGATLTWSGLSAAIQPWGGVNVSSSGTKITTVLPVYNPLLQGSKTSGNTQGWGLTIQDANTCTSLANATLQCSAN